VYSNPDGDASAQHLTFRALPEGITVKGTRHNMSTLTLIACLWSREVLSCPHFFHFILFLSVLFQLYQSTTLNSFHKIVRDTVRRNIRVLEFAKCNSFARALEFAELHLTIYKARQVQLFCTCRIPKHSKLVKPKKCKQSRIWRLRIII
jgi:hypothetical protein